MMLPKIAGFLALAFCLMVPGSLPAQAKPAAKNITVYQDPG